MKFFLQIILTILVAYLLSIFLPFYSVCIAALLIAILINMGPLKSFFAGFIAIFLLWGITYLGISSQNDFILLERVSGVFTLSPALLILVSALLGGILGGLGAAIGSTLRSRKRVRHY